MFRYVCLNPIAQVGLDVLEEGYEKVEDLKDAQAALVRSASMHDMELPDSLEVVARAGAGVNIRHKLFSVFLSVLQVPDFLFRKQPS